MNHIELTAGQIKELSYLLDFESEIKVDRILVFEDGNIQVYYNDGNPKVKDISIYD